MEDDLKNKIKKNKDNQTKNGKRPKQKWKTNQSTKINLIGCDTIVNSPSLFCAWYYTLLVHHTPRLVPQVCLSCLRQLGTLG